MKRILLLRLTAADAFTTRGWHAQHRIVNDHVIAFSSCLLHSVNGPTTKAISGIGATYLDAFFKFLRARMGEILFIEWLILGPSTNDSGTFSSKK